MYVLQLYTCTCMYMYVCVHVHVLRTTRTANVRLKRCTCKRLLNINVIRTFCKIQKFKLKNNVLKKE